METVCALKMDSKCSRTRQGKEVQLQLRAQPIAWGDLGSVAFQRNKDAGPLSPKLFEA